ncbi:hypothetical protein GJ496_008521 [Pomphorhynchus laevis]|nr:hypothetical protein GJ496_008521 [Pomphorhynchus laevis]
MSSLLNRSSKLTQPNNTGTTFTNSSSVEQSVKSLNPNIAKDGSVTQKISMDSTDHQNSLHQTVNNDKLAHLVSPLDQYLSQLPKQPKHASKTSLLSNEEFDDLCKRLNGYCQRLKDYETNRGFIQGHQKKQDIFEAYKDYQHLNISVNCHNLYSKR